MEEEDLGVAEVDLVADTAKEGSEVDLAVAVVGME